MTKSDPQQKTQEKPLPEKLGRYRVLSQLGAGGMGHVYRVYDPVNDRELALKELKFDYPRALHYFKREFRAVASLSHPHLVSLHDLYHEDDRYFYTMELVEGRDIYHFVNQHNHVIRDPKLLCESSRLERVFQCLTQLLQALDYLHSQGRIHRDIKPANILVDHRGKLRLVDFGVIKEEIPGGEGQSLSQVFGTSTYFSPEQSLSSRVTSATDIYAAGVVLYELLVGVTPFEGTHEEICEMHRSMPPKPILEQIPQTHEKLAWVCHEMLAKEPARRPSAREILEFLNIPLIESSQKKTNEFIGRRLERDLMHSALDGVSEGRGQMILIEGEEGVGKASLVEAFCQEARLFDASCFQAACVDRDHVSYRGIDTIVERIAEAYRRQAAKIMRNHIPQRERAGLIEAFSFLGELIPSKYHGKDEAHSGPALGLFSLFKHLSEQRQLVIVLEHVHLADDDALDLLEALQSGGRFPPVLFILTYCPEQVRSNSRVSSFLEYASTHPSASLIKLQPFAYSEVQELTQLHLNRQNDELINYIIEQTGGLPGFVLEMVTAIKERQRSEPFQEIIIRKINTLSRPARRILAVVCLSNAPVPEAVLERACDLSPEQVYEGLIHLSAEGLIREVSDGKGRVDVIGAHPRLMEVSRTCVSVGRAPMIHERIARALEHTEGRANQLERHWTKAGAPANATQFALRAAHIAREANHHERAVEMFHLSLKGQLDVDLQIKIRVDMADSLARSGRYLEAAQTLEALTELSMSEALRWRARRYQLYLMSGELSDILSQSDTLSEKAKVILADLLLSLRPLAARSLVADESGSTAQLVKVCFLADSHNEKAISEAERLLEKFEIDPERVAFFSPWGIARIFVCAARAEWTQAAQLVEDLKNHIQEEDVFSLNHLKLLEWESQIALERGKIHEAKTASRQLLVIARSHGLLGIRSTACTLMALAHIEAGEDAAATRLLAEAQRCRKPHPRVLPFVDHQIALCKQLLYRGHIVESLVSLRTLRRSQDLQPLLTRRTSSLQFSLLHGRAVALLALSEHYKLEIDRSPLTGSLAIPSRELLEQACEILERALPRPKAWLTLFKAFQALISNDWQLVNTLTTHSLKSTEECYKTPLIRSIFGALYLLALKRAAQLNESRNQGKTELHQKYAKQAQDLKEQLSMQRRRAGLAPSPEVTFINAIH